MIINDDIKLDYSDVLIRPKRSTLTSRFDVEMKRTYTFYHSKKEWTGVPIMAANMDTVGTFEMHKTLNKYDMVTCIARHYNYNKENWWKLPYENSANTLCVMGGISEKDLKVQSEIYQNSKCAFLGLDVANGYTISFVDAVKRTRDMNPDATIIAGNVVTADMTQELILAGADIVKVGVGPGSVCTTRIKTGIGFPQLSAVIECADAAHGLGGHIIADGGCNSSGDIVKAFAGGADFVMIGGMLAGHDECDGELIFEDDVEEPTGMKFYGMASESAMDRHQIGNREYRGVEGKTVTVPYRGAVENTLIDILSGVRSACTYMGAKKLKSLSKCATFIRVNNTHNGIYE
jgi:GMP reductase